MEAKRLMKVTYQDLKKGIRLNAYADAVIWSEDPSPTLAGLRFGGYAEVVRGLTDAIYGGATIEIEDADGSLLTLKSLSKQYHREVSHEGLYAEATLIAEDEIQESSKSQDEKSSKHAQKDDLFDDNVPQQDIPAHICYIFCHPGNEDELFQAIDQKSYVPMIPEYQDYVLAELKRRRILRPLRVRSLYQELEAWKLCCEAKDQNLVKVMEDGLKQGKIKIPGAAPGPSLLDGVHSVTDYLNTFGVAVAERIKKLFVPLFDPATEPLSEEVLDINEYIRAHAGYSLYDAQLAVAESIKRKLGQSKVALIVAGCGTGKTKIGSVAVAAAGLQSHQISAGHSKTFSIVLCPAHVTKKWVREIEESIPNTFAAVVRSISEFDLLYKLYEQGSRNCFAIISKEKARDGYMRAPAVIFRKWNREGLNIARPRANEEMPAVGFSPLRHVFCCPDCGAVIMENISKDGVAYCVPAGPRFFRSENRENHKCKICGSSLWTALNPTLWNQQTQWAKLGSYGFVFRPLLNEYREDIPNEAIRDRMTKLANCPDIPFPIRGAYRTFPLSSYIKRAYKGKIFALIADELHQYNNNSGQGDAMQELLSAAKKVVGMTATLVNGYSSGLFYLLYRIAPRRMCQDGKPYRDSRKFDTEYGVIQNIYEEREGAYNSNRRTVRSKKGSRLKPGVSPLVYTRFLLDCTAFLNLTDMGKVLPEYEEIPVPIEMAPEVRKEYKRLEDRNAFRLDIRLSPPPQKSEHAGRPLPVRIPRQIKKMDKGVFTMLNYNTPLTAEESAFAAEHHHLLLSYLKKARLDFDEFYDIAVFGYLRAVRKYLARPELRAYQFSTIAFRAMSCDVHHSREYWLRGKRCGRIVQTLNDDQNADDLRDSVTESVDNVIQFEAYTSTLTPLQQRIAELRDIGYSDREISAICGIPYKVVALEMEGAKRSILEVYIGDAPRAA